MEQTNIYSLRAIMNTEEPFEETFEIIPSDKLDVSRNGIKPKYLNEIASDYWDTHASTLAANGLLTALTADSFAICCRSYQRLLEDDGKEQAKAYSQWIRLAIKFHLVPDSTATVKVETIDDKLKSMGLGG